jgi:hypothetical protein
MKTVPQGRRSHRLGERVRKFNCGELISTGIRPKYSSRPGPARRDHAVSGFSPSVIFYENEKLRRGISFALYGEDPSDKFAFDV